MNLFDYLDVDAETVLDIIENKDSYYFTYHQRKRSGKYRKINVPNAALKGIQRAILYKILYKFSAHPIAHGFVKGKSPITNAKCHVGASALINIDLQNFFNTITESKVSSTLESLLPNLDIKNLKIDEMDHIIIASLLCYKDILIQGGPASPTMSNLVMYSFDTKLLKLIDKYNNAVVTRYADDISVSIHSSDTPDYKHMKEIASKISILLNDESLRINYSKLKFSSGYLSTTPSSQNADRIKMPPESYGVPGVSLQPTGDRKGGVVWHTQGSGKSLTMVFYTGKIVLMLNNPTIVVITDRNDLDDQLFDTFAACKQLLRQAPVQAENREHLKKLLKVASGGIVFTTIQKFQPDEGNVYEELSDRKNIVVIADEAHRTQYGFKAKTIDDKDEQGNVIGKKTVYGFAKYLRDALPNATYLGFTGTPIEKTDINTPAVFGNYIDIYDIAMAVEDGATVRIYYESRLAKIHLSEEGKRLVEELDEELKKDDLSETQKAKAKWTQLEALVGSKDRIKQVAKDIVTHFEARQEVFEGKGMIVAMSRRIAVELYDEIIKLRPQWHSDDLSKGVIKVVMTAASSDGPELAKHHTTKEQRRALAERMKDPQDEMKLVIVRDMWLTGFDVPCLHTMYIDKPMKGHNLMQAIARVNRVYKDKPGGLVVDYLGIASDLKKALSFYSESGGKGDPTITQEEAVQLMLEKIEVVSAMFHLPAPPPSQFCVYAIMCENNSIYIGQTENLMKRWSEHLAGTASDYTKRYRPIRIAHYEECSSREEALQKECEWKTGYGRKRLKRLIEKGGARQAGGFNYEEYFTADTSQKLSIILAAEEHILGLENGKKRYVDQVTALSKAFAIAILGGMGSLVGSVVASFVIGYAEVLSSFLISEQLTELVALVVIVLVLILKPSGIMGYKIR